MHPWVYWIYPSPLAERHLCAWESVFQLYSISCPWELPAVLLYQHPSSEYWQSQKELFPPWWPEDNEGTKHPAPTRDERSGCLRAWALNNIIWLGDTSVDQFFLKTPLCQVPWRQDSRVGRKFAWESTGVNAFPGLVPVPGLDLLPPGLSVFTLLH